MIEGVRLAPYIEAQRSLKHYYPWMDCSGCLANNPAQARAAFLCGYLPKCEWVGDGKSAYVPGSPVLPPSICPGWSANDHRVHEVAECWGHWKRGQLQLRCPEPSEILMDLISMFNGAMAGAESYVFEQRKPTK